MEEAEAQRGLCAALEDVDNSLGFLLLIVGATLLSVQAVFIQRRGLCLTLCGDKAGAAELPPVFPLKCRSSAIIVGSLGFFLCLALKTLAQTRAGDDPVALRSAETNVLASALVLAAALLRLDDLRFVERCQPALAAEDTLPN